MLKKPYVPVQPDFGPVFYRGKWEKEFKKKIDGKLYHLYHGPSAFGKSMAIAHALAGREGVLHLRYSMGIFAGNLIRKYYYVCVNKSIDSLIVIFRGV